MKLTIITVALLVPVICCCQKTAHCFSFGLDKRFSPVDIENVPRGQSLTSSYGYLTHESFWNAMSIHAGTGIKVNHNWYFSVTVYARYGRSHYIEDPYIPTAPTVLTLNENAKSQSKARCDLFVDAEKKLVIRNGQQKYVTISAGLGFTNFNSGVNLSYRSNISGNTVDYQGSYLHFGPRVCLGYQVKKIKGSLDAYFIEDPLKTNLISVWTGISVSYEFLLKKKMK